MDHVTNTMLADQIPAISNIIITCVILVIPAVLFYRYRYSNSATLPTSHKSSKYGRKLSAWESLVCDMNKFGFEINCYIAFVESLAPLSVGLLEEAASVLQKRHPLFRMTIIEDGDDDHNPSQYFVPMDKLSVDVQEVHAKSWEDLLAMETKRNFNMSTGPLWRLRLLKFHDQQSSEDGVYRNIIAATFFHTIVDGNCIMRVLNQLMDVLSHLSDGDDVDMTSCPLLPALDDFFQIGEFPWWKKIFIKSYSKVEGLFKSKKKDVNPYIECFGAEIAKNPTVVKETRAISIELGAEEMQKLREICREHGATVNGATTAAASIAACRIMQGGKLNHDQTIGTICMANMRKYCDPPLNPDASVALFCTMMDLSVTVTKAADEVDKFWKIAANCTQETRNMCKDKCKVGLKFLEMVAIWKKIFNLTFLDVEADVIADEKNGSRTDKLFLMSNLGDCSYFAKDKPRKFELVRKISACSGIQCAATFCHYIVTLHGKMFWSVEYHTNVCTRTQAQEYADAIEEILKMAID